MMVSIQWKRVEVTALITYWFHEIVSWKIFKTKKCTLPCPLTAFSFVFSFKMAFPIPSILKFSGEVQTPLLHGALTFLPVCFSSNLTLSPCVYWTQQRKEVMTSQKLLLGRLTRSFAHVTLSDIEEAAQIIHLLTWVAMRLKLNNY